MKNNIFNQVFHSGKFLIGFIIFMLVLLLLIIYPVIVTVDPLEMVAQENFLPPGTYVLKQDVVNADSAELNIDTTSSRAENTFSMQDRSKMQEWLIQYGSVKESDIDVTDIESLIELWNDHYDSTLSGNLKVTEQRYYKTIGKKIEELAISVNEMVIASKNSETGELSEASVIGSQEYAKVSDIQNKRTFLLGTDNFGRDVLTELVSATKSSLIVGLIAGFMATLIGLSLGLLAGYMGGFVDNFIVFVTNIFTVIPSFVLLILISYSVGQSSRGFTMVAVIIGLTSWPWTCRSVRSQVISLRSRDHVNMMKLSGHSLPNIILTGILPYIASYVVMALILQIAQGILAEAQLSMIGLGAATSKTATLGLMMNWATLFAAHLNGSWWAYFPVIIMIALISFSMNLMNTGLDQVFNPQLRS